MPRAWTRRRVTQQGPQFARTGGLFLFVSRNVYQRRTAFARGDFAADGIAAKGSDDHVRVMAAALLEPFSFSTFQRLSCLLMRNGSVPQPDAGQLASRGQPNQSGYVGKSISLSFSGKAALEQLSINARAGGMMSKQHRSNSARLQFKCIQPHKTLTLTAVFLFVGSAAAATGRLPAAPTLHSVNASRAPRATARWSRSSRGETSRA
jgi:hypothetical protein